MYAPTASAAGAGGSAKPTSSQEIAGGMVAGGTFINFKAGMQSSSRELVAKTVFEMSKGSKFYANEQRKADHSDARIAEIKQRLAQRMDPAGEASALRSIDRQIAEMEANRDLTRTYMVVDMDAFYAKVEERHDLSLRGQPFAVGGIGMICTANYEARKYGVRRRRRRRLPQQYTYIHEARPPPVS